MGTERLLTHIGMPTFVNFSETYFSCVDGRYRKGMLATAGGDAAEFILALNAASQLGYELDQFIVDGLFKRYVEHMGQMRRFYMHTDEHSWLHLTEELELPPDFDITAPPDALKGRLLEALVKPSNVGCGHIKGIISNATMYKTPREIPEVIAALLSVSRRHLSSRTTSLSLLFSSLLFSSLLFSSLLFSSLLFSSLLFSSLLFSSLLFSSLL